MRIFVTGAAGFVGENVSRDLSARGHEVVAGSRETGFALEAPMIPEVDAVVHCAAIASVRACADDPARAHALNVVATRTLTREASRRGIPMIFASTDLVFDGTRAPYDIDAIPDGTSAYARTKIEAERAVLEADHIVLRLALVVGTHGGRPGGFLSWLVGGLARGERVSLYANQFRTPLYARDIAPVIDDVLTRRARGVHHLAGATRYSREEIGRIAARVLGISDVTIVPTTLDRDDDCSLVATRTFTPLETALTSLNA